MKLLAVVTSPPDIYKGWYTQKKFWEDKFTPVIMKSFGRRNASKHTDIKDAEHKIALDISLDIYCLDNM